ncbi:type IX secretion system PorP/SprF family membrane protein [Mucilaginibacter gracilis]|uniref:Type IX secretion system PorP/SprF family membrane protein n=1 Tax=Mucilaginibacter gracilis TaxID=423350 RepID=A0A495J4W8_9SPHI|nr:type IX secretion system membrane protein PorP/SprF [Mucilaginibacter gracilis]RKR83652.1 type IX secretion system PorP/SprF family membrane protein [Mucilaginibacter gracilis]
MKKFYFAALLLLVFINVKGQQQPQYTQYIFNQLLINPAVSGIENYVDVKSGYRSQWTGLAGAPVTTYFTITAPIGRDFIEGDAMEVPAGDNPVGRSYVSTYRAAAPHHGIGLTMYSDKAGPIRQTSIDASYAYHLGLTPDLNLSAGVSGGITNVSLNTSEVSLQDPLDPAIYYGNNSQIKPNVNAGIWAYSATYFIGASVQQLLPQTLNFANNSAYNQSKTVPHYYFTAGYKLFLSDDISLMPSLMYKIIQPAPNTVDLNLKMAFRDHFWIAASYRQDDAVAGMMGFTISSFLSFGYSYDYTTSNLNTVSTGTHELFIGIHLNNSGKSGSQRLF